ncbi:hypothetical protein J6590_007013 [Homalodisca vitripennis]|nr:hypothetical protein J6590_007013 [Homalodisca vitripennis]
MGKPVLTAPLLSQLAPNCFPALGWCGATSYLLNTLSRHHGHIKYITADKCLISQLIAHLPANPSSHHYPYKYLPFVKQKQVFSDSVLDRAVLPFCSDRLRSDDVQVVRILSTYP